MKTKFSSYIKKFRWDRLQIHIWGMVSEYMRKCANIYPYMTLILWSKFPDLWGKLDFLFYTATAIPFIYFFSGNSAASAPISTFICLWAIYIFPGSVYIFPPAEQADPSWEYIILSQTHECGNWDWGPDIPFLGIFVSNFRHYVFAVYPCAEDVTVKKTISRYCPFKGRRTDEACSSTRRSWRWCTCTTRWTRSTSGTAGWSPGRTTRPSDISGKYIRYYTVKKD